MAKGRLLSAAVSLSLALAQQCTSSDWLVCAVSTPVTLTNWTSGALSGISLGNGLVSRSFVTSASGSPLFATWDYLSYLDSAGVSLLRTFSAEASVTLLSGGSPSIVASIGGATVAGHSGNASWVLVGPNEASMCSFVAQGPTASLGACEAACWANAACNIVNWIAGDVPANSDCVLKACAPGQFALSPYTGCDAWSLANATAGPVHSVNSGPYLNRSGLDAAGVLAPMASQLDFVGYSERLSGGEAHLRISSSITLARAGSAAPAARFAWTAGKRGSPPGIAWPPRGLSLTATFAGAAATPLEGLRVDVVYEVYEGSAALSKWVIVSAQPGSAAAALSVDTVEVRSC